MYGRQRRQVYLVEMELTTRAMAHPKISVKKGREWQLRRGHPWLFSGGISQVPSKLGAGDIVDLVDTDGKFIARGYYNAACDIAVRLLTVDPEEQIDRAFVERRVQQALDLRAVAIDQNETDVYRLINAEGDFLPGIIADRFAGTIVLQSHTAGGDRLLPDVITALVQYSRPTMIVLRNDAAVRKREGLEQEPQQVVYGQRPSSGHNHDAVAFCAEVREHGLKFSVDPVIGQKTGFFADQRDKRIAVGTYCRQLPPKAVLANCFSYSAAFAVYAAKSNSNLSCINVDQSARALELARENFAINDLAVGGHEFVCADAFAWLEEQVRQERTFQFVILDPPAFAKSLKDKSRALKAYTRLNRLGLKCCARGALLMTCSCSGIVSLDDLQSCLQAASAEAGRSVQVLEVFKHGADHPVNVAATESQYLKVLLCRIL
jgi:23S rRNA (cytosine1962-C5)-methyltransferase